MLDISTNPVYENDTYRIFEVTVERGGDCMLIVTQTEAALIDCGFAFCAPQLLENINAVLGGVPFTKLLLTHSHYDHAAASAYLRENVPGLQVYSTAHAKRVFSRPGARATMRELNASAAADHGYETFEDVHEALDVDVVIEEGSHISVGSLDFVVLETPGHTRDTLAFHCEKYGLTVSNETVGIFAGDNAKEYDENTPDDIRMSTTLAFLVSYRASIEAIDRLSAMKHQVMLTPHCREIFTGQRIDDYLHASRYWAVYLKDFVLALHEQGLSDEEILQRVEKKFFVGLTAQFQPKPAFMLNMSILIPMVIAECAASGEGE